MIGNKYEISTKSFLNTGLSGCRGRKQNVNQFLERKGPKKKPKVSFSSLMSFRCDLMPLCGTFSQGKAAKEQSMNWHLFGYGKVGISTILEIGSINEHGISPKKASVPSGTIRTA